MLSTTQCSIALQHAQFPDRIEVKRAAGHDPPSLLINHLRTRKRAGWVPHRLINNGVRGVVLPGEGQVGGVVLPGEGQVGWERVRGGARPGVTPTSLLINHLRTRKRAGWVPHRLINNGWCGWGMGDGGRAEVVRVGQG